MITVKTGSYDDNEKELSGLISFSTILYHGTSIQEAATTGNLPLFVLLWTMAKSKNIKLFVADNLGNTLLHYAALAEDNEVLQFTVKQLKGAKLNNIPLYHICNNDGDTPLMLAISKGYIPVVQTLLNIGCNIFENDKNGLNIFNQCCKYGHLWLLHYLYTHISKLYDEEFTIKMLRSKDNDGHGVIEWSANSHNVQLIEYLIRKGIDPGEKDNMGRDSLHWAVKSGNPSTIKFFVNFGLDPRMEDINGVSPLSMALQEKNGPLLDALRITFSLIGCTKNNISKCLSTHLHHCYSKKRDIEFTDIENTTIINDELWKRCYTKDMKSHAIYIRNNVRLNYLFFFTVLFSLFWFISICFTFYTFIINFLVFAAIYKYGVNRINHKRNIKNAVTSSKCLALFEAVIEAPEKFVGMWLCAFCAGMFYLLACYLIKDTYINYRSDMRINDFSMLSSNNFLILAGTGAAYYYPKFYFFCVINNLVCLISFLGMVFLNKDPGIIDTRAKDFEDVLSDSLKNLGPPTHAFFCRTTMCRKPMRSKYCVKTGALVARMDHYCKYLNNCIGYKNHRTFILFLLIHGMATFTLSILVFLSIWKDFNGRDSCYISYTIFTRHYWFNCLLGSALVIITVAVLGLLGEQLTNISQNITINERLNGSRYDWLVSGEDKSFHNKFNKGWFQNFLDFFRIISYNDYYTIHNMQSTNDRDKVLSLMKLGSNGTRTATTSDTLSTHSS